jgi:hypothetical protein
MRQPRADQRAVGSAQAALTRAAGTAAMAEAEEQIILEEEIDQDYEPTQQGESPGAPAASSATWRRAEASGRAHAFTPPQRSSSTPTGWAWTSTTSRRAPRCLATCAAVGRGLPGRSARACLRAATPCPSLSAPGGAPPRGPEPASLRLHTQELLWIALEGLKAPLPPDWKPW